MTVNHNNERRTREEIITEIVDQKFKDHEIRDLSEVRPEVIEFLKDLRPEEIAEFKDAIVLSRKVKAISSFFKWLVITGFGIIIALSAFGEGIIKIKNILFGK